MALAGRATSNIELGTSVLQTYPCHPTLQASRIISVASAVGRGVTLGIGPSHQPAVERLGLSYEQSAVTPRSTSARSRPCSGAACSFSSRRSGPGCSGSPGSSPTERSCGWPTPRAVESHVKPRITSAASAAGRAAPRIVAGLPLAVHGDETEARAAAGEQFSVYGTLPNYQRILAHGGISSPAEAAVVGDEKAVERQVRALFDAGVTDVWAAPFPVGADRSASRARTRALLVELANR